MEQLISIQSELKCPKGNYNSFGKYKYRSAEDILESVKPILHKYKCTLIIKDDVIELGTFHVLKSTAVFSNGKDVIEVTGLSGIDYNMKGMSVPQMYGTASSYARKYALNGLFLIDETEADADNQNTQNQQPKVTLEQQVENAKAKIINATSLDDLTNKWKTLTKVEQSFQDVIELSKKLAESFKTK
jgi:hypothetical protein